MKVISFLFFFLLTLGAVLKDPDDPYILLDQTRDLGRVVVRGPLLQGISPVEGSESIANPFTQQVATPATTA